MTDVQRFELPRDDWYDEDGRLYKDVIIENLNACEQKLFEIQGLDAFHVDPPDFGTIVYPDVTLESDERSIVNLKSFLSIMNIVNYPLEILVDGTTFRKVSYWNSEHKWTTLVNKKVDDIDENKPFAILDCNAKTIEASDTFEAGDGIVLIGLYAEGVIKSIHSDKTMLNINLLQMLSSMKTENKDFSSDRQLSHIYINGNVVGYEDAEGSSVGAKAQNMGEN